ncbi:MAG: hypothetical protein LZF86_110349 [Nitrospira sp.]|nr:MAG: hypothetical protein LZF86_110349 [Nitrospira sp.]
MSVAALASFDPSKFFQASAAEVSAAADLSGRLSVTTAEGDKITLTADVEARYRAVNYQAKAETDQGTVEVAVTSVEASLKKQYGVTVEGDLNEQELHDLEKLFRKVGNIFRQYFRGQDDDALARTAKLADKFGGLSSLSSLDLSVNVERSVTVVAAQVAAQVAGQPAASTDRPASVSSTQSATTGTPGVASSTAAAIPQPPTSTTAPTQPSPRSTDAATPAAGATTHLVVAAPDASQPKSLVQQVLDALEEAKAESQKVRKYLPDFLKKLREDLVNELQGEQKQARQTSPAEQPAAPADAPAGTVTSAVLAYRAVSLTSVSLSIRT